MIDKIFADFNNLVSPGELIAFERAQGRNLYRFGTELDFIPSLSFFLNGKLTEGCRARYILINVIGRDFIA